MGERVDTYDAARYERSSVTVDVVTASSLNR
jgi:hypothetical protein